MEPARQSTVRLQTSLNLRLAGADIAPSLFPCLSWKEHITWKPPNQVGTGSHIAQSLEFFPMQIRHLGRLNHQPMTFSLPG